jgi:hypothetical protein
MRATAGRCRGRPQGVGGGDRRGKEWQPRGAVKGIVGGKSGPTAGADQRCQKGGASAWTTWRSATCRGARSWVWQGTRPGRRGWVRAGGRPALVVGVVLDRRPCELPPFPRRQPWPGSGCAPCWFGWHCPRGVRRPNEVNELCCYFKSRARSASRSPGRFTMRRVHALTMQLCPRGTRLQAEQSQPSSEQPTYPGYGQTTSAWLRAIPG